MATTVLGGRHTGDVFATPKHSTQTQKMTAAEAELDTFYSEFSTDGLVYTVRDDGGFPAPANSAGVPAMPFWSSRRRAQKIVDTVPAFRGFEVVELHRDKWLSKWLLDLQRDGILVGLNWTGEQATGGDVSVADFVENLNARESANQG